MQYKNTEIKLDVLVSYLNDNKINLAPPFQRGHVWKLKQRRKLIENIIDNKPIPAVFLYKDPRGAHYSYNILDGKQRLESIVLFLASQRADLSVQHWHQYFFSPVQRKQSGFTVSYGGKATCCKDLPDSVIADLREYSIPTIEITLDDATSLDQIISLFVDINQQGEPVKRFDIAKAMYRNDKLLKGTFDLIAISERRGKDEYYKLKNTPVTRVMSRLQAVVGAPDANAKVDRIWERLLEFVLFSRTKNHRSHADVLKDFMGGRKTKPSSNLTVAEKRVMREAFDLVAQVQAQVGPNAKILTDQTHFYTLLTYILQLPRLDDAGRKQLAGRIAGFSAFLEKGKSSKSVARYFGVYLDNARSQTTHANRRTARADALSRIMASI